MALRRAAGMGGCISTEKRTAIARVKKNVREGVPPRTEDPLFRVHRGSARGSIFSTPRHCRFLFFRARGRVAYSHENGGLTGVPRMWYTLEDERVILP